MVALKVRSAIVELVAKQELGAVVVVQIGLIVRAAPVHVVEIEGGSAEVGDGVGITVLGKCGHWVEGDVMIDELAEVGVERWNPALFGIETVFRNVEARSHETAQHHEGLPALGLGRAKGRGP